MSRKVYVTVTARLILRVEEGIEVGDVIDNMEYGFSSQTDGAEIEDTEIEDFEVTDSK